MYKKYIHVKKRILDASDELVLLQGEYVRQEL